MARVSAAVMSVDKMCKTLASSLLGGGTQAGQSSCGRMMGNSANSIDGQITRECMQMRAAAARRNLSESVWHIHPLISTPVHHTTTRQRGDTWEMQDYAF